MAEKAKKTRPELEVMVMAEVRKHPECSNVEAVAITRPRGRPWDVAVVRDGPHIDADCWVEIRKISARLCTEYDLDEEPIE